MRAPISWKEHGFTLRSERLTEPVGRVEMVELTIGTIVGPVVAADRRAH